MPRHARKKSESGIYHIMLRGINQQVIFEDEEDYAKMEETIRNYKYISGYKILAYCFMSNHFHLLLKTEKEDLAQIFKRIAGSYVYWYNWKYHRTGHLFQDRFKSEPVDGDAYLLAVMRYIHQNPIKAKLAKSVDDWKYSSYSDYIKRSNRTTDIDFVLDMLPVEQFIKLNEEENNDICLDIEDKQFRINDSEARMVIEEVSNCKNASEFQALPANMRESNIHELKEKGLSIRQIARLTGVSFSIVRKV